MTAHTRSRHADPIARYTAALRATTELEAPYGAAMFVLLTTLLRTHELLRPTTTITQGSITVDPAPAGLDTAIARRLPLPGVTRQLLGKQSGPLLTRLGVPPAELPRFAVRLRDALTDHEDLAGLTTPEQALPLALRAVLVQARSADERTSVLTYAGLASPPRVDPTSGASTQLQRCADLVDHLAARAGFLSQRDELASAG